MIPSLLHFIWIQKRQFGRIEYLCLKSALKNTPYDVVLHTNLKPGEAGIYCPYDLVSNRFSIDYQPYSCQYKGVEVRAATMSDILRIRILQEQGGIYSDIDMLWLNPIPKDYLKNSLLGIWENQSYKILTNSVIACEREYDFTLLLKEFDMIFDLMIKRGITNISGDTLKEHLTLFKSTGAFLKKNASCILKKKYFGKNGWRTIYRFLQGQVPESTIVLEDICGIHLCGCGLFGNYKCDTTLLVEKHAKLKEICDSLLQE